ncbi:hypothetical protein QVD17_34629 [Tagetes erecta]|uniref:Uncharacterized protein n=1 Tax=Tagetes erecta TaxID=13708 RepID=A0AAD8K2B0_TARER|nr:hypothetical protein QVD17_34629 [Tagetes erecta]
MRILRTNPQWCTVESPSQWNKRAHSPEFLFSEAPNFANEESERTPRRQKTPFSPQNANEEQLEKILFEFKKISDVCKAEHEDKKRHRATVEEMKGEELELKKREMKIQRKEKDFQFYIQPHQHLSGSHLAAFLQMKEEIMKRWGWK